jgi:putative sigma-54 modulation protein
MHITVKSKAGALPDDLRRHAEKKLAKLERYFRSIENVELEQSVERGQHVVELLVAGDGILLRSQDRCGDPLAAIDNVIEKMETQVKRFKTRVRRSHQRPGAVKELAAELASAPLVAGGDGEEDEEFVLPRIVRRKRFPMKPMPAEEAARQMELLDHDFFVFINDVSGQVNVLYRRKDGGYGLIEPEA